MTKIEILNYLRSCIKEGSLREDDFFESAVFYRLSGRFPDIKRGVPLDMFQED